VTAQRRGQVFRRCTRCGANLTGQNRNGQDRAERHAVSACDGADSSWSFVVDVAAPGAPRIQRRGGGFAT
jgi:hypothetical protein